MRSPIVLPLAIAACLGLLATGCGGSAQSDTLSPTPSISVSADDLPGLVLDLDEVSVDGTVLPYDPEDSGPQSRADYTEEGIDTEWWAETLEEYDWQAGYYQDFGMGAQGSPVFNASVELDLYDTPENAAGALAARFERAVTWEGQGEEGVTIESIEIFDIDEFDARGMIAVLRDTEDVNYFLTNIDFARGPLIVDIGTASLDERDLVPATRELMRQVNERLVAAGLTEP